jgi:hypothetical protein
MSTAFYPQGMKSYNNHVFQGGYKTWKGTGVLSNPVGIAASHIRPLTNNDSGNVFPASFGKPRPIKHFRKGRVIPGQTVQPVDPSNPVSVREAELINYNINRFVQSSTGSSLGGGAGGRGLLNEVLDNPGSYLVKQNRITELNESSQLNKDCRTCEGAGVVVNYYPNNTFTTNNPNQITTNKPLCCNEERKARRRTLPASTLIKKNYYTTHAQYMENRCQTFEQKSFNFVSGAGAAPWKPGSALALTNEYIANCQPNGIISKVQQEALVVGMANILLELSLFTLDQRNEFVNQNVITFEALYNYINSILTGSSLHEALRQFNMYVNNPNIVPIQGPNNILGCKVVTYKPSNPQFAYQGAVSSSTQILKKNVVTIESNAASLNRNYINLKKQKDSQCGNPVIIRHQNKKSCNNLGAMYLNPRSQPSPYRYYIGSVFPTNHFAQSPRKALM